MSNTVLVEHRDDGVSVIVLNRPSARNAVDVTLAAALVDAIAACQGARCIVITGSDPAFCAGLDLRDLGADSLADLPPFVHAVSTSGVPTIAAVNGAAVTGGFEVALACDFIVASDRARFADTHVRVGVYPGPVLVELPRRVGMAKAREMSMTGDFVDADQARRIGLANHLVAHDDLMEFTVGLASSIAEQNSTMVAAMRRDWDATGALPIDEAHRRHIENALGFGFAGVGSDTLRANMGSVIDRAHQQLDR